MFWAAYLGRQNSWRIRFTRTMREIELLRIAYILFFFHYLNRIKKEKNDGLAKSYSLDVPFIGTEKPVTLCVVGLMRLHVCRKIRKYLFIRKEVCNQHQFRQTKRKGSKK